MSATVVFQAALTLMQGVVQTVLETSKLVNLLLNTHQLLLQHVLDMRAGRYMICFRIRSSRISSSEKPSSWALRINFRLEFLGTKDRKPPSVRVGRFDNPASRRSEWYQC